ncbi:hypothetical protein BCV71DRAFT_43200 [Rhizopus microsporus]|uniref:Uncharacterized protein n=1 Tax=Rhizopus microsporus TaxID=58291 RepID=A0A1X0RS34_RHIZD|nr:hypothetical protein BCV71DRAFT_43200 [Rhizopus microsporus]
MNSSVGGTMVYSVLRRSHTMEELLGYATTTGGNYPFAFFPIVCHTFIPLLVCYIIFLFDSIVIR